ncbi:MAG: ABC transporter permease [Spirochaetales bacterium]
METRQSYSIETAKKTGFREKLFQWETMLGVLLLLVLAVNTSISPYFLSLGNLIDTPSVFLDKSFIVFPMMLTMILGGIDVSVGSTVALSAVIMAVSFNAGLPMEWAILLCLLVGTLCGMFNGWLLVKFHELSPVIVTISTMIIFRGIAYIILGDQASSGFPQWFSFFGWGSVGGVPFLLIMFALTAFLFGILLHKTTFGRTVYGIGSNRIACVYSAIDIDKVTFIVFTLNGLMAGLTAVFLTSRMGSTRPNVALGYELEVITMVALGGVSTTGGVGKISGPILSIFIIGYLSYGMGLANIQAPVVLVVIGLLLILSVLASKTNLWKKQKTVAS